MKTIDIRHMGFDPDMYARLIWERLFRFTDMRNAESFDSFLCDLNIFSSRIDEGCFVFLWYFDEETGWTEVLTEDHPFLYPDWYRIEVIPGDRISLQRSAMRTANGAQQHG